MRSNGLTASAYTPVADLDPRVADALLLELKVQGVAAYTKPVESSSTSGFDRPEFRVDVKDRLYVDASASDRVTEMISAQDPALTAGSDDLTWAQIVAGFDQPLTGDPHPWPVTEDVNRPDNQPENELAGPADAPAPPDHPADRRAELRSWLSGRDATLPDHDDMPDELRSTRRSADGGDLDERAHDEGERFVPPTPPPLPQLEPWQQLAWVGLVGGPILLFASVLFSFTLPGWVLLAAAGGFIGGFVTLIATMKDRSDTDDDPDNGAVV